MDTRLPSERGPRGGFKRKKYTRGNGYYENRYEETFAYDLQAFKGVGAPVIISEGFTPGSDIWTVFHRKLNGTGLRHIVGSPEGTIEEARAYVEAKIRAGRFVRWTEAQQAQAAAGNPRRPR